MLWPALVGPSYRARSPNIDAEASVNLFPETVASSGDAKKSTLIGTPGLKSFLTVDPAVVGGGPGGCRGWFSEDGRTFVVIGTGFFEVLVTPAPITPVAGASGATTTFFGLVPNDSLPVSMASNGRGGEQLAIVSGGQLFIFNLATNVFTGPVTLPLTNAPVIIKFIDGYFLLLEKTSIRIWFSALEDGTSWNALDFFARSSTSDNLVGLDVLKGKIWRFGSQTTDTCYNSGDALTPFVPYAGSIMQEGLVSPYAEAVQGEAIMWVSRDSEGVGRIVRTTDYAPERISTPAIDVALASYPTLTNAEALVYEQEGHPFIAWTFPSGGLPGGEDGVTWSYDSKEQQWHQRAGWDEARGIFTRWRARGVASTDLQNTILVGDYATGDLYTLDLETYTDNGHMIRRLRRCPFLSSENQWLFLDRLELGIESGVGITTGQGIDPQLMLRVSRDSGHTWGQIVTAGMGRMGEYGARAIWRRLGRVRADRLVLEISQSDPVKAIWGPGAWLTARPGTGGL